VNVNPFYKPLSNLQRPSHLVTGATGFVGAALVLELLRRTDDPIVVLVRPDGDTAAPERFRRAVLQAARAYDLPVEPASLERCHVVPGDVTAEGCGVPDGALAGRVSHVWHGAASLRYENRYTEEINEVNVGGTRNVLGLAARSGAAFFNYVSTAYVSGRRTGTIREDVTDPGAELSNQYERSKVDAEGLVAAAAGPMRVRILRPSIVVGHSRTLAATTFSGFYGFVRQLVQFRGMVARTQQGLLERTALQIRADATARTNLMPVDAVAHEALTIGLSERSDGVYHLTHPSPPTVAEVVGEIFRVLELHPPAFVGTDAELPWLDSRFDRRLDFYRSYITGNRLFDRSRSTEALGAGAFVQTDYDAPRIAAMTRWYLAILEQERSRLPVAR
jgi:thioester reductase-like protein